MKRLEEDQIQERLATLDGWTRADNALCRTFSFDSFGNAIAFVNRVAALAEAADHHPDFLIEYRNVTLTLSTHSAGGITARDTDLAAAIR
ncbi:MAG: 4a-hydroxytetrahydrobiopterin dehydratase [Longimicrobiales bacterium]